MKLLPLCVDHLFICSKYCVDTVKSSIQNVVKIINIDNINTLAYYLSVSIIVMKLTKSISLLAYYGKNETDQRS